MNKTQRAHLRAVLEGKLRDIGKSLPDLESSYREAGYSEKRFIWDMYILAEGGGLINNRVERDMKKILKKLR